MGTAAPRYSAKAAMVHGMVAYGMALCHRAFDDFWMHEGVHPDTKEGAWNTKLAERIQNSLSPVRYRSIIKGESDLPRSARSMEMNTPQAARGWTERQVPKGI